MRLHFLGAAGEVTSSAYIQEKEAEGAAVARRRVRIFGEEVPVRAEIYTIGGLSAHADQGALLDWLGHFRTAPGQTWIVHGEPSTTAAFADAVRERLGWSASLPQRGASASF